MNPTNPMNPTQSPKIRHKRFVAPPTEGTTSEDARAFYNRKLAFETDPSDVHHDLEAGVAEFVLVDARQIEAYEACRIPGAIHLPHARIRKETTDDLDPNVLLVTYCWGPGCNSSTKAATRLSSLGFTVREMIGGIEYWRREGYSVEGSLGDSAPFAAG